MSAGNLSRFFQSPINRTVFRWSPPGVSRGYMRLLGRVYFSRRPKERDRYLHLLRETFHPGRCVRRSGREFEQRVCNGIFDHYFEKMLLAYWDLRKVCRFLRRRVRLVGSDLLDQALSEDRGVILTTGHFGGLEFLPVALALQGYPVTMVVKFKTLRLKQTLENVARILGIEALDAGEGVVLPRALASLRKGRIFIIELDEIQHWKPSAHKVMTFFGRRVQLDRTVEVLHRRTGAPVLLGLMERRGRWNYQLVFETPQEHHPAPTGLGPDAQLLKRLEHYIYDHPDHWYLWKDLHHLEQLRPA